MILRRLSLGSLGAACFTLVLALACGGKGSSAPTPAPTPAPATNLAGAWIATVGLNETGHFLVMPSGGDFRYQAEAMNLSFFGNLQVSGTNLSGTATAMLPAGSTEPTESVTLSGTASPMSISATLHSTNPQIGDLRITAVPDTAADSNAQLTSLEGTWASASGKNSSRENMTLSVDSGGKLSTPTPLGNLTGTFTQAAANANAFTVTLTLTPADGSAPKTFAGAAYLRESASQLIVSASDATGFIGGIFTKQ